MKASIQLCQKVFLLLPLVAACVLTSPGFSAEENYPAPNTIQGRMERRQAYKETRELLKAGDKGMTAQEFFQKYSAIVNRHKKSDRLKANWRDLALKSFAQGKLSDQSLSGILQVTQVPNNLGLNETFRKRAVHLIDRGVLGYNSYSYQTILHNLSKDKNLTLNQTKTVLKSVVQHVDTHQSTGPFFNWREDRDTLKRLVNHANTIAPKSAGIADALAGVNPRSPHYINVLFHLTAQDRPVTPKSKVTLKRAMDQSLAYSRPGKITLNDPALLNSILNKQPQLLGKALAGDTSLYMNEVVRNALIRQPDSPQKFKAMTEYLSKNSRSDYIAMVRPVVEALRKSSSTLPEAKTAKRAAESVVNTYWDLKTGKVAEQYQGKTGDFQAIKMDAKDLKELEKDRPTSPVSQQLIVRMLKDGTPEVQLKAATMLKTMAIQDPGVQQAAVRALSTTFNPDVQGKLISYLESIKTWDKQSLKALNRVYRGANTNSSLSHLESSQFNRVAYMMENQLGLKSGEVKELFTTNRQTQVTSVPFPREQGKSSAQSVKNASYVEAIKSGTLKASHFKYGKEVPKELFEQVKKSGAKHPMVQNFLAEIYGSPKQDYSNRAPALKILLENGISDRGVQLKLIHAFKSEWTTTKDKENFLKALGKTKMHPETMVELKRLNMLTRIPGTQYSLHQVGPKGAEAIETFVQENTPKGTAALKEKAKGVAKGQGRVYAARLGSAAIWAGIDGLRGEDTAELKEAVDSLFRADTHLGMGAFAVTKVKADKLADRYVKGKVANHLGKHGLGMMIASEASGIAHDLYNAPEGQKKNSLKSHLTAYNGTNLAVTAGTFLGARQTMKWTKQMSRGQLMKKYTSALRVARNINRVRKTANKAVGVGAAAAAGGSAGALLPASVVAGTKVVAEEVAIYALAEGYDRMVHHHVLRKINRHERGKVATMIHRKTLDVLSKTKKCTTKEKDLDELLDLVDLYKNSLLYDSFYKAGPLLKRQAQLPLQHKLMTDYLQLSDKDRKGFKSDLKSRIKQAKSKPDRNDARFLLRTVKRFERRVKEMALLRDMEVKPVDWKNGTRPKKPEQKEFEQDILKRVIALEKLDLEKELGELVKVKSEVGSFDRQSLAKASKRYVAWKAEKGDLAPLPRNLQETLAMKEELILDLSAQARKSCSPQARKKYQDRYNQLMVEVEVTKKAWGTQTPAKKKATNGDQDLLMGGTI